MLELGVTGARAPARVSWAEKPVSRSTSMSSSASGTAGSRARTASRSASTLVAEEHLLQLFPGEGDEVVYKAEDDFGERGRYTPAPAEPPAPQPPGPTVDEVLRGVLPNLPNSPRLGELPEGAPGVVNLHVPLHPADE